MGEAKRRKLLDPNYGKGQKVSFCDFSKSMLRIFERNSNRKGCCCLFFDSSGKKFSVYPTPADVFFEYLNPLGVFGFSIKNEFKKIQIQSSVLPVLIVPDDKNVGVFFGFDVDSGEIPNWLIDESFDVDFVEKVVRGQFFISGNTYTNNVTLRFCEGET